nr:putative reverse transcriptase domain-containing protein [Tanacetum cinerariifolium]
MSPRMRTQGVDRPAAESLGGERVYGLVEVEGVKELGKENVGNVIVNGNWVVCSYKEFLACNPKEYDEFYPSHETQKLESELWNYTMVRAGHVANTDRFHELARLVLRNREMVVATKPKNTQKAVQISSALTDEAVRNRSIKKVEKVWMIIRGLGLGMLLLILQTLLKERIRDCRGMPRNVNPVNARNPSVRAFYECGSTDHVRVVETKGTREVQFLGHVINGLDGYYRRFIENLSKIAKSLTILTQRSLPDGPNDFMVYFDALGIGLGCVLMQRANVVADALSRKERVKPKMRLEKKSYANKRRKPLEFSVGDYVLLKLSPWKGVVRFGKKGKLAPKFVGPFEIIEKVGPVAYRLDFPEGLNGVHDTFHMSNFKKCLADLILQVPLDEIRVDAKLNFVEEPVKILEREFKKLKRSRISIVKVRWNSKPGPEFMWEREDLMKLKYPHLFSDVSS